MGDEIKYLVKWRTSREDEKYTIFEWDFYSLDDALKFKKEQELIQENIEVKLFKVEITEL